MVVYKERTNSDMARKAYQNKSAAIPALTQTEIEALKLAAQGYTAEQIAQTMEIAPRTATRHIHRALKKLLTRWPAALIEGSPKVTKTGSSDQWNRILTRKAGESRIKAYIKRAQLQPHSSWAYIYILLMNITSQPYRQPTVLEGIPQHVRESDTVIQWDDHEWVIFLPAATRGEAEAVTRRMTGERSVHFPFGIGWSVSGLHDDVADAIQTARRLALEDYAQVVFYSTSHNRMPPH
ncbi:MAG: hypothetical protein C7B44_07305 [Sulfobacillus thermosulfidooxidans]|nr:MAG: hypothetical protein C7B44_07305 [Sulfobacillus thermosulfidooxidans]